MRLAILHPNQSETDRLAAVSARAGHAPTAFTSGQALHDVLGHSHFPVLLLRWDGPGVSGVALMRRLRARLATPPTIIMLVDDATPGAIAEDADLLLADPCGEPELIAALNTLAERRPGGAPRVEQFEDLAFDRTTGQAQVRGQAVLLTAKEFALALLLLRNCDQAVSRDQIMVAVWGRQDQQGSRTLDAHIAQVRKRLLLRPEHGWRLSSVYGFGYRLDRVTPDA